MFLSQIVIHFHVAHAFNSSGHKSYISVVKMGKITKESREKSFLTYLICSAIHGANIFFFSLPHKMWRQK
jgi:hypothetical protein